jgi:hypothetical protein
VFLQIIKESTCLFAAMVVGVYSFKKLNNFYKIIFLQVLCASIIYVVARLITYHQKLKEVPADNQWVFNVYIILEVLLLSSAATLQIKSNKIKIIIAFGVTGCLAMFGYHLSSVGFYRFANNTQIVAGILIIAIYLYLIFSALHRPSSVNKFPTEVWLYIGLCLYFACNVPLMAFIHYLYSRSPELTETLFNFITNVLGNIRYLLTAISFWIFFRKRTIVSELI